MKKLRLIILLLIVSVAVFGQSEDALPMKSTSLITDTVRVVKDGESALMQKSTFLGDYTSFFGLDDTPNDYISQAGRFPLVNVAESSLEFPTGLKWFESEGALRIGNDFTDSSASPLMVLNKNHTISGGNGHGFVDINNITLDAGYAYAAFDARSTVLGTADVDHVNGFQSAVTYSNTATIDRASGMSTIHVMTSGTITNAIGYKLNNPSLTGGSITNYYGLYMDGNITAAENNWFLYNGGTTESYLGGDLGIKNSSPAYELDVTGDVNVTGSFRVNGTPISTGTGYWVQNASDIYYNSGNVGIGTSAPDIDFHVRRNITSAIGGQYYSMFLEAASTTDMVDQFGPTLDFGIRDDAAASNRIVRVGGYRDGNDISGKFFVGTSNVDDGGVGVPKFTIDRAGWAGLGIGYSQATGALDVESTTGAFIPPRMTTLQREALAAVEGSFVYDTDVDAHFSYRNGAWGQLASGTPVAGGDILIQKSDWHNYTFGLGNGNTGDDALFVAGQECGIWQESRGVLVPEELEAFVEGASGDATIQLYHAADPTGVGTAVLTTALNVTTAGGLVSTTLFDVATIPSGNYIWAEITATGATEPTKIRASFNFSFQ